MCKNLTKGNYFAIINEDEGARIVSDSGGRQLFFASRRLAIPRRGEDKGDKKDKGSSFFASRRLAILQHCCLHYYNGREDKKDKKDKGFFLFYEPEARNTSTGGAEVLMDC